MQIYVDADTWPVAYIVENVLRNKRCSVQYLRFEELFEKMMWKAMEEGK